MGGRISDFMQAALNFLVKALASLGPLSGVDFGDPFPIFAAAWAASSFRKRLSKVPHAVQPDSIVN